MGPARLCGRHGRAHERWMLCVCLRPLYRPVQGPHRAASQHSVHGARHVPAVVWLVWLQRWLCICCLGLCVPRIPEHQHCSCCVHACVDAARPDDGPQLQGNRHVPRRHRRARYHHARCRLCQRGRGLHFRHPWLRLLLLAAPLHDQVPPPHHRRHARCLCMPWHGRRAGHAAHCVLPEPQRWRKHPRRILRQSHGARQEHCCGMCARRVVHARHVRHLLVCQPLSLVPCE
mmetsp:Transcript_10906/g.32433  ORF Transcript_10906/g.32433 Transcript_10906/m.32433 type:complete len:231 (-) Transcript_10906:1487-2179(-)